MENEGRRGRIYISGPITGVPDYMGRFEAAEAVLKAAGWDVVNPAKVLAPVTEILTYDELMAVCLVLMDMCGAVQLLPGWRESRGAMMEFQYALEKCMDIYAEED